MNLSAASLYQIDERGLELRRAYMGMTAAELELLGGMQAWADRNADAIGAALAEHTFSPAPPAAFLRDYAERQGHPRRRPQEGLGRRAGRPLQGHLLRGRQARRLRRPATSRALLGVGALHSKINLPLKWFLGTYPVFLDLVHEAMLADTPEPARVSKRSFGPQRARASTSTSSTPPSARSTASSTTTRRRSSRPSTTTRSRRWASTCARWARPAPAATSPTCSAPCATRCTRRSRPSAPRPSTCRTCARP